MRCFGDHKLTLREGLSRRARDRPNALTIAQLALNAMSARVDLRDPQNLDLALRIGRSWSSIRRGASMIVVRDFLCGTGADAIELGQMDTLDVLIRTSGWRMSELADALRVDPSTATRAVQRLVTSGLADRSPHVDDGRVVMVAISDKGRRVHDEVMQRRGRLMAHMLEAFEPTERDSVAVTLERFVAAIDSFRSTLENDGPSHDG